MQGNGYGVFILSILSILFKVFFAFLRVFAPLRSAFDFRGLAPRLGAGLQAPNVGKKPCRCESFSFIVRTVRIWRPS